MELAECRVGWGITGSFCTFAKMLEELKKLVDTGAVVTPVFSFNAQSINSRFGDAGEFIRRIENITTKPGMKSIEQAEAVGPGKLFDIMVIAPCTGNTLAKLCNGIVDSPVLMAAKAHLRNEKPLLISVSTNDALGMNFKNIGCLMNMKNIYFVPFGQDDYIAKPNSMIADITKLSDALVTALEGKQLQPVILGA
ncbi:MAG: dipicolinate synthase subunit B [Lachnospiraceae bacterium]|nr:dipicolinate synthase subunit B [Lachnospiraceae bacterium]